MRPRDLVSLSADVHDVLVVGGGIYGLAIALESANRGLRVALVEAADFGSGTSFHHQKTVHGGLRSLRLGRLAQARESIRERRAWARMAPRLLRPLPFIVPTYRSTTKSRLALGLGLRVDGWLARDRNDGVASGLHLRVPRLVSRATMLELCPDVAQTGLTGGAMWHDYQIVESDRLTVAVAEAADAYGARLANYAQAREPLRQSGRIAGMRVCDRVDGREYEVRARLTINAAGAHAGEIMRWFGVARPLRLLKAMNLMTRRPSGDVALAAPDPRGRMLTLVSWRGCALVGTSQSADFREPGDTAAAASEVESFLRDVNHAFPALRLSMSDVTLVHRGLLPAVEARGGCPALMAVPQILDHAREGAPGAMTVVGVKYTTARGVAARVVGEVARLLARRVPQSETDRRPLPGAGPGDHEAAAIATARGAGLELAPATIQHLAALYGDRSVPIIRLMGQHPDWRAPLAPGRPNVGAEVVYAIRHEMAQTVSDIVIRRTGIGSSGRPDSEIVARVAYIAASELGWSPQRIRDEVAAVGVLYELRN